MAGSAESKTNRISWIDVLKGIGIILVVIGHTSKDNFMVDWLYTFHMPLFFALSGYLWSQSNSTSSFSVFLQKRIKTLLWPFVFFRIVLVLYWIVVESHFRELDLGPIWFLIVLFVAEIAGYLFFGKRRDSICFSVVIFLVSSIVLYALGTFIKVDDMAIFSWTLRFIDGFMWYVAGILTGNICKIFRERSISNPYRPLILAGGVF